MNEKKTESDEFNDFLKDFTEIGKDNELRERWKAMSNPKHRPHSLLHWAKILAIVISISILAFFILRYLSSDNIYKSGVENIAMVKSELLQDLEFRGSKEEVELMSFRQAIKDDHFEEALNYQKNYVGEITALDQLLMAIAYVHEQQFDLSNDILQRISQESSLYDAEAKWILANLYLIENKNKKAAQLLSQIVNNNEYKSTEASRLLKKIK